jgi:aspartyl protease family protein
MDWRLSSGTIPAALLIAASAVLAGQWLDARHDLDPANAMAALITPVSIVDAPVTQTVQQHDGRGSAIEIERDGDGMFYLDAMVNDRPHRFLIDTGASAVVLSRSDAQALGIVGLAGSGRTFRTVGGARTAHLGRMQLKVPGGMTLRDVEVAIVNDDGVGVSLLGQSALQRIDQITIQGDRMLIR